MSDDRVAQASAYLRMLLLRPGDARSRWERHATRPGAGEVDADAVAALVTEVARRDVTDETRRALDGTALDTGTLRLFADAFDLDGRDTTRLRDLLDGSTAVRVITGEVPAAVAGLYRGGPPRHQTLALHELHVLGPDGSPAEHQTIQVIKATEDGVASYPYRFDTDELAVEVIRGGRVGDRIYRINSDLHAVDIVLDRSLAAGETILTQVRTTFRYRVPPPPEFRRGVMRATNDVTIWVRFDRARVPARVWLAYWDRIDHATVLDQRPVELDDDLSVHHRFGAIERSIVGFHWEWA